MILKSHTTRLRIAFDEGKYTRETRIGDIVMFIVIGVSLFILIIVIICFCWQRSKRIAAELRNIHKYIIKNPMVVFVGIAYYDQNMKDSVKGIRISAFTRNSTLTPQHPLNTPFRVAPS